MEFKKMSEAQKLAKYNELFGTDAKKLTAKQKKALEKKLAKMADETPKDEAPKAGALTKAEHFKKKSLGAITLLDDVKNKDEQEEKIELGLSDIDRILVNQGLIDFINKYVYPKDSAISVITYNVWLDLTKKFKDSIPASVRVGWENRDKRLSTTFLHQTDEFIMSFWNVKAKNLEGANVVQLRNILLGLLVDAMYLHTGEKKKRTVSNTMVHLLLYLKSFNYKDTGLTHKDRIADLNFKQVRDFLETLVDTGIKDDKNND